MWDRLAVELATIRQVTRKYTSLQGLKQKYPGFLLWSILTEAEQRELLSEDFRPRAYAGNLVLRRYGLAGLETLRKDRAKLRKASRNRA